MNAKTAIERSNTGLVEKGLPKTSAELDTWFKRNLPPPLENAAFQYLFAAQLLDARESSSLRDFPVSGGAGLPGLGQTISEDTLRDMTSFMADTSDAFVVLEKASVLEASAYPRDSLKQTNIHRALQALQLRALHAIATGGDGSEITTRIEQFAHGAESFRNTPAFFACKNRATWTKSVVEMVERALNSTSLEANDFDRLDAVLTPIINDDSLVLAIAGERCVGLAQITKDRSLMQVFFKAEYCEYFDYYLGLAEEGLPHRASDLTPGAQARMKIPNPYCPNLHSLVRAHYDAKAFMQVARAAIQVQSDRAAGRELPEMVDGFSDAIRASWPVDPYSGNRIQYKKMDAGFITYSMGYDGTGDGALPSGAAPNAHREGSPPRLIFRVLR